MTQRAPLVIVTGVTQEIPAADTVKPVNLGTGTPDVTKVLRGDGAWVVAVATDYGATGGL